jgi:hypothetical protein
VEPVTSARFSWSLRSILFWMRRLPRRFIWAVVPLGRGFLPNVSSQTHHRKKAGKLALAHRTRLRATCQEFKPAPITFCVSLAK